MPSIKWQHVLSSPTTALKIIFLSTKRSIYAILIALTNPSYPLTLRTALVRAWYGTSFTANSGIWYSAPATIDAQRIDIEDFGGYVIPDTTPADIKNADMIYIYAHGGGMFIGHPLQYLNEYKRWIAMADKKGKRIVILASHYPLSPQKKWPAQRIAFLGLYSWALSQGVSPSRIIFGGDSGGANLVLLSLLYLRDHASLASPSPSLPLPCAAVLHSPAIDLTSSQTKFTPRVKYDYIFEWTSICDFMNDSLRPEGLPFDTPEISPLLADSVGGLPPQLVYWSPHEILATDASRWIERSEKAGVKICEHKGRGQLHTYSLGWPFVGRKLQDECDELLFEFFLDHIKSL